MGEEMYVEASKQGMLGKDLMLGHNVGGYVCQVQDDQKSSTSL
jgi:hypothetical protein